MGPQCVRTLRHAADSEHLCGVTDVVQSPPWNRLYVRERRFVRGHKMLCPGCVRRARIMALCSSFAVLLVVGVVSLLAAKGKGMRWPTNLLLFMIFEYISIVPHELAHAAGPPYGNGGVSDQVWNGAALGPFAGCRDADRIPIASSMRFRIVSQPEHAEMAIPANSGRGGWPGVQCRLAPRPPSAWPADGGDSLQWIGPSMFASGSCSHWPTRYWDAEFIAQTAGGYSGIPSDGLTLFRLLCKPLPTLTSGSCRNSRESGSDAGRRNHDQLTAGCFRLQQFAVSVGLPAMAGHGRRRAWPPRRGEGQLARSIGTATGARPRVRKLAECDRLVRPDQIGALNFCWTPTTSQPKPILWFRGLTQSKACAVGAGGSGRS